jgi:hypothetical protein
MDFIGKMFESIASGLGNLIGQGIGAAGDKVGATLPAGRPMDRLHTRRRLKGDEKELFILHKQLERHRPNAMAWAAEFSWDCVIESLDPTPDELESPIIQAAHTLCLNILAFEGYYPLPQIDFTRELSLGEIWDETKLLRRCLLFYETQKRQGEIKEVLVDYLKAIVKVGLPKLPSLDSGERWGETPVLNMHLHPARAIECVLRATFRSPEDDGRLSRLADTLMRSSLLASGINPDGKDTDKLPKWPSDMTDKSPEELISLFLGSTPLSTFFSTRLPFTVPQRFRFEHTHIVGGSGHGKTQLLQTLILQDMTRLQEGKASVIVIDSQGDMIRKIRGLQTTGGISDRVVIIDPTEIEAPPALNLFDFGLERAHSYNALEREMLVNGAISLYEYVFGALLGAELTARQGVIFRYLAHLLMVVPDATIHTLIDFMEEPEKIAPYIGKLEGSARRFFETQFLSRFFNDTRQQILTRIYGVLATGVLDRMFSHKRNKVNLFAEMNRGSLILINTAKDLLKQEGTEILGRFFIALICQAAQERASIPEDKRMPTFVYIDEAHDYFDESMENLFNQARKYAVGLCVAHQNLDQFEQYLRATVMTSTAIKLVGGLSAHDATAFAKDMHTEPEYLLSMRKHDSETQFACFVRNLIERPIPLSIPFGTMERQPKLSPQALQALRLQNRARYSVVSDDNSLPPPQEQEAQTDQSPMVPVNGQATTTPRKRELL